MPIPGKNTAAAATAAAGTIRPVLLCTQCHISGVAVNSHAFKLVGPAPVQARRYHPSRRRAGPPSSVLGSAISAAQGLFSAAKARAAAASKEGSQGSEPGRGQGPQIRHIDPLRLVGKELKFLKNNIRQLLGSGHPLLDRVAKYYTQSEGKQIRPLLVLLMSQATALAPRSSTSAARMPTPTEQAAIDHAIGSATVLADANPDASPLTASLRDGENLAGNGQGDAGILPSQQRLAEIIELIHTASLLHDDVIDNAVTRRSFISANVEFGNKMAVLAGDFLLGRASVALARLRDPEVTELIATVIANLIEGEFMQLKNTATEGDITGASPHYTDDTLKYYLQKTYLKSASLISKSCRAAALLGRCDPPVVDAAYAYGRNLGLAFQLVDDMLDYTVAGGDLGKPAGADLELGLATAPLLFAWRRHPELGPLVGRRFAGEGDVQMVCFFSSPPPISFFLLYPHLLPLPKHLCLPMCNTTLTRHAIGPRNCGAQRWRRADAGAGGRVCGKGDYGDCAVP